jgi:DNA repair protein RadD
MKSGALSLWQETAAYSAALKLRAGRAVLLVAPTGAGKTRIAADVAKAYQTVLVVGHRRELLQQARAVFGSRVHVHSIQSALRHGPQSVDLLVIDEAHRAAASTYRQIIAKYPMAARLGLTATPLRTDGQGLRDAFDEIVFGAAIHELIESGALARYRAFEAPDEVLEQLPQLRRHHGDYASRDLAALMNQPRLVGDVVKEYLRHASGRKAVAFAVNIDHSKALKDAFSAAGVRAAHLDGRAKESARALALDRLQRGDLDVLCNVNLFTEGWDCPAVSCVIMARPTASLTLYLQSVGRGLRPAPGKPDLIILDHAGNMERHDAPDAPRDWSIEGPRQRAKRDAEIAELERLHSLGFDSIEAELEEKRRARSSRYTAGEVCKILGVSKLKTLPSFLRNRGVESLTGKRGTATRYSKEEVDQLATLAAVQYSTKEAAALLGCNTAKVSGFLKRRGVLLHCGHSQSARYLKCEVDGIRARMDAQVTRPQLRELLGGRCTPKILKLHGVVAVGHNAYARQDIEKILSVRAGSYTVQQVADLLNGHGIKVHTGYYLKSRGVTPHIKAASYVLYWRQDVDGILLNRTAIPEEYYRTSEVGALLCGAGIDRGHVVPYLRRKGIDGQKRVPGQRLYPKARIDLLIAELRKDGMADGQ